MDSIWTSFLDQIVLLTTAELSKVKQLISCYVTGEYIKGV